MSYASDRINMLATHNDGKNYLEVGVASGKTFFSVNMPNKVAVDPNFTFDLLEHEKPGHFYYSLPSDDFFAKLDTLAELQIFEDADANRVFDIFFLDGLHTYEQILADFIHSQKYAHAKTIWVIDDTVPSDPYSALPHQGTSLLYRRAAGLSGGQWHGDVFKVIFKIYEEYKNFSYCTVIDKGNPQTILWQTNEPRRDEGVKFSKEYADLSYFDIFDYGDIFMPVADSVLPNLLYRTISPFDYHQLDKSKRLFYSKLVTQKEAQLRKQVEQ